MAITITVRIATHLTDKAEERLYRLESHNYFHKDKNNYFDKLSDKAQ